MLTRVPEDGLHQSALRERLNHLDRLCEAYSSGRWVNNPNRRQASVDFGKDLPKYEPREFRVFLFFYSSEYETELIPTQFIFLSTAINSRYFADSQRIANVRLL